MSAQIPSGINPKEKGRAPEGCGQGCNPMLNVVQEPARAQASPPVVSVQSPNKKLAVWLDGLVAASKKKPVTQIISLTPDLASVLLDRNPANRKVSRPLVETYAHDIRRGAWSFNGQTIVVSDTGQLNDGQHRCEAVIEAGCPIEVLLIVGVSRDTRTTLDQGRVRTAADFLAMQGNINATSLAAAANFMWQFRLRGILSTNGNRRATKSEIVEFVRDNPGLLKSVHFVQISAARAVGGPSILAFVHFALKGTRHPEDADFFVHSLMNGAGLKADSPILYARNRLINESGRLKANDKAELIFKAWNAWRTGRRLSKMIVTGGVLPVLED